MGMNMKHIKQSNWPKRNSRKNYTFSKDWAGQVHIPNTMGFGAHYAIYDSIRLWIAENVHKPYSNAQWAKIGDCIYVHMKREDDFISFLLKFA